MVHEVHAAMRAGEAPTWLHDLFRSEYGALVRIASSILRDPHRAEDVAQEAFLALMRTRRPPAEDAARAWLHAAAAHRALNVIRAEQRRVRRDVEVHLGDQALKAASDLEPLERLERSDEAAAVRTAILRMPERDAAILALRHSGRSYIEVARALGISVGQVGTRLRRAESRLRKELSHASSD